jgi:Peptidase family M1 domain
VADHVARRSESWNFLKPRTRRKSFHWIAAIAFLLAFGPPAAAQRAAGESVATGTPVNLAAAPTEELLKVYAQLRDLKGGNQWAIAENVVWKRDRATFTFQTGKLTFAAPIAGRVVAAAFDGAATFELDPPTPIEQAQIARFTGQPRLVETFHHAVFFFTDDSAAELQKLVYVRPGMGVPTASREISDAETSFQHTFNDWWQNQQFGNFPMRNLAARMLSDMSDPSSRGISLAAILDGPYAKLLYQISWNRPSILLPDLPNDEEVMLLHYKTNNYYEWWAGYHVSSEYQNTLFPERPFLPAHCAQETLWTTISPQNRVSATAELKFRVLMGQPRVLPFNLDGVLRIQNITDAAGRPLAFIQEDRNLDSDPWLILPAPAVPEKTYDLKIAYAEQSTYESQVVFKMGTGLYFTQARTSWYPSFGAFKDRTQFDLHFVSPKNYEFAATGKLVSSRKEKDDWVSEYTSQIPFSVVGFTYGDFVTRSRSDHGFTVDVYAGRHLADQLAGLQNTLDLYRQYGYNLAHQYGILEGGFDTAAGAQNAVSKSFVAFKLYEAYFGPLPFHTIRVTEQPVGFSGQSWPTLIFLPYLSLLDTATLNSLRLQTSEGEREFFDAVSIHEMSHQWWGHMVGWRTYHDQWLSEGFADFSAALFLEYYEPEKFKAYWDNSRDFLLNKDKAGHHPVDVAPLWLNFQGNSQLEPGESQLLIYNKGAYVLEMLRAMMQKPGSPNPDARFIAMMRDFVSTYAGQDASTVDFQKIVEKYWGEPMDWFFNEWVYGTATPTYRFTYQLSAAPQGQTMLQVSLEQSGVPDSFRMEVPLYVYWKKKPQLVGFIVVKGSATATGRVPLPERPSKVSIDVNHTLLAIEK